jgi:aldehyde dehydrogenase (NAD+)
MAGDWGRSTATERGRILARIGALVLERAEDLARIEAQDVGKPLSQARADALALARYMEFYAGAADKVMGQTIPYLDGYTVYTLREPHGVTAHIVPWNYPMQIIGRSVGAALAMGNACVLKPAEEASLTALAFARLAQEAGLPPGALNVVPGLGEEAGAALSAHPGVNHISFTGSVAGRRADPGGGGAEHRAGDAGTGRQVARRSSFPMPISTPPCPSSSTPASRTRARPARPPAASSSTATGWTR